jgi:RNA polymerase sigma factor (sigma-70 family)
VDDVVGVVLAARTGDSRAWKLLVDGHTGLVWSIVRGFRFDDDTAKDVFQTVWLRLAENLERIREPAKLASWLGQTTRNECVGVTRQRSRIVLTDDVGHLAAAESPAGLFPEPGAGVERDENRLAVSAAFARLGERCQQLLRLLLCDPPVSYDEISDLMELPLGSIGPTRARCLASLRSSPEISRITEGLRSS